VLKMQNDLRHRIWRQQKAEVSLL